MAKKPVTKTVTEAIIKAFPAAANMEIAPHPLGNGYCVYDADGNVAGFEYDIITQTATLLYDNITNKPDPKPAPGPAVSVTPAVSPEGSPASSPRLYPRIVDISWRDCPTDGHGALPGLLNLVGIIALVVGALLLFPLIYPGVALIIVAMFFFWFAEVLTSLRHIEAHLYSSNHPDWVSKPESRRKN